MKALPRLSVIIFSLFAGAYSAAQQNKFYTFQILDYKGSPIQKARLVVLSDASHFADPDGFITYYGEDDYVVEKHRSVKIKVMPRYIHAKAPGYQDRKIDLSQYAYGANIVVKLTKLDKLSTDYRSIDVFVKDKSGKPISGAAISVNPGKPTSTDAGGFAKAMHTILLSGEYVAIEVYKEGYKMQKQYIPSGDAPRMENGRQIPPATAYFILEKGGNSTRIFHINVEVLDDASNEPVSGASVRLELSDGDNRTGTTNGKGEFRFSDNEYSFSGLTSKVKVSKPGYEEKWSDITGDLTEGIDNAERQFLVYIKKKKENIIDISGTWNSTLGAVYQITQSGNKFKWTTSNKFSETADGEITGGNSIKAKWTGSYTNGAGTATVSSNAAGKTIKIQWSNGVVFMRD